MVEITYQMMLSTLQTVGLLVGIFYYIMTLRNTRRNQELTLENRQAQVMMQLFSTYDNQIQEYDVIVQNIEYDDFDDFWEKYGRDTNPDFWNKYVRVLGWLENLGVLVKAGLLDMHLIALTYAGSTRKVWEIVEPTLADLRDKFDYPRWMSETEYLCKELIKYMDEHPELKT